MFARCVLLRAILPCSEPIAIFLSPSLWHLTTRLNSSPDATKLEPVGPDLLIGLLRATLYYGQTSPILTYCCNNMFWPWQFTIQGYSKQFSHLNLLNSISLTSFKHQLSEQLTDYCTCTSIYLPVQPIYNLSQTTTSPATVFIYLFCSFAPCMFVLLHV